MEMNNLPSIFCSVFQRGEGVVDSQTFCVISLFVRGTGCTQLEHGASLTYLQVRLAGQESLGMAVSGFCCCPCAATPLKMLASPFPAF